MLRIKEISEKNAKECFVLDSKSLNLWSIEQWKNELITSKNKAIALFKDEKIIGVCVFQIICDEAELHYIAIHPKYLRKGFGNMLFSKFISFSKKYKIKRIFLEVSAKNHAAINFYEAFDFKTISIRKKYYKDGSDAILKVKVIC